MKEESLREVADRLFGRSSWPWISDALSCFDIYDSNRDGTSFLATLIAASHGNRDWLLQYVEAAKLDHFQVDLHREWLDIEEPYARDADTSWFVQVIRKIAPEAIHRGLHALVDFPTLLIDRRRVVRDETITMRPHSSGKISIGRQSMASNVAVSGAVPCDEEMVSLLIGLFESLPHATKYSKWMPIRR